MDILPTVPACHKIEISKNCKYPETISSEVDVNTIYYSAFAGCANLKEIYFCFIKTFSDYTFNNCASPKNFGISLPCQSTCNASLQ